MFKVTYSDEKETKTAVYIGFSVAIIKNEIKENGFEITEMTEIKDIF